MRTAQKKLKTISSALSRAAHDSTCVEETIAAISLADKMADGIRIPEVIAGMIGDCFDSYIDPSDSNVKEISALIEVAIKAAAKVSKL